MSSRWTGLRGALLAGLASAMAAGPVSADDAKAIAYGRHLSQQCTTCHRVDGVNNGIPVIVGWPVDQFVAVMGSYKRSERDNPVMVSVTQLLDEPEFNALAAYFASLKREAPAPPAKKPGKQK